VIVVRVGDVVVETDGDVLRATIDRPQARNAIDEGVLRGLEATVETARSAGSRIVVLRGSGGSFCAGADLGLLARIRHDDAAMEGYMTRLGRVLDSLAAGPYVSVAVVEGYAVAGGLELLLAADIVIAASDARIGDRHLEYGLVPAAGGSVRLSRAVSRATANYLLFTGELLDGRRAVDMGLVALAVDQSELADQVEALVSRLRARSPDALRVLKEMCALDGPSLAGPLRRERELFLRYVQESPDVIEGLDAFGSRRVPAFGLTATAAARPSPTPGRGPGPGPERSELPTASRGEPGGSRP
jgi:enoyl-CoA hydratase/carnithine racemase